MIFSGISLNIQEKNFKGNTEADWQLLPITVDINILKYLLSFDMKVYLIPGLGFDSRIFQNLRLEGVEVKYLDWVEPKNIEENFSQYSKRLADEIDSETDKVILVGHSFGGIICLEIAKHKNIEKVILISSIKSRSELPLHFKNLKYLRLYKLFSKKFILRTFRFWGKYHGYVAKEERELFENMISQHSDKYLQWSLLQLSNWNPDTLQKIKIVHIHGDMDKTFPARRIRQPFTLINNSDHFMVFKQAEIISRILQNEIGFKPPK